MTMLSDKFIRQAMGNNHIKFASADKMLDAQFQPASVDLRLDRVDLPVVGPQWRRRAGVEEGEEIWELKPGQFALASTMEAVTLSAYIAARVEGKSSLGRRALQVHSAGFIDPGFGGQITLELVNLQSVDPSKNLAEEINAKTIRLTRGMMICQVSFHRLTGPALRPYGHPELGSHYQGQHGITRARA